MAAAKPLAPKARLLRANAVRSKTEFLRLPLFQEAWVQRQARPRASRAPTFMS
jgi:hypothetical protein